MQVYWGETKTWYGIPGSDADRFEDAMKSEAPELFEQQPGLLYNLVTMMNPGRVREAGVKVVACDQRPNEFVITWPKAYHCGFNHGVSQSHCALPYADKQRLTSTRQSTSLFPIGYRSVGNRSSATRVMRNLRSSAMTSCSLPSHYFPRPSRPLSGQLS